MDKNQLLDNLRDLHSELRDKYQKQWKRSISFEDELFDRWEKASFLGFGEGTSIYSNSIVLGDVKVGKETWIGPNTLLDGSGGLLAIGDNCSISTGVQIYTHDTVAKRVLESSSEKFSAPTSIGNNCFIGPLSIIQAGVKVGNNVIIGAHSYVNKDVPDFTVAFGVPCKEEGCVELTNKKELSIKYKKKSNSKEEILKEIDELRNRLDSFEKKLNKNR